MKPFGRCPCLLNVVFMTPMAHLCHQVPERAVMENAAFL
jgi:hypothetical protein